MDGTSMRLQPHIYSNLINIQQATAIFKSHMNSIFGKDGMHGAERGKLEKSPAFLFRSYNIYVRVLRFFLARGSRALEFTLS